MNYFNQWSNYLYDSYNYKSKLEEWDVVLPPIPPVSLMSVFSANENWGVKFSQVDSYIENIVKNGGIKRKVFCVVFDTGAKSNSSYVQTNFIDLGLDHTGENQPIDENFHFSHVLSSINGTHPTGRMGVLDSKDLPNDWYLITGEKVLSKRGVARYSQILAGFKHGLEISKPMLEEGRAVVWNCSFGGFGFSEEIDEVLQEAEKLGIVIICAAGNSGEQGTYFPATTSSTIGVGAVDVEANIADFSSRGDDVDISAPGVDIWGADFTNTGTRYSSGTSMASPMQTGLIMLMLGANPSIANKTQLLEYISKYATDLGIPGKDINYGNGVCYMNNYPLLDEKPSKNKNKQKAIKEEPEPLTPIPVPAPVTKSKRKFWSIFKRLF
jgi:subtilisin family serine protease